MLKASASAKSFLAWTENRQSTNICQFDNLSQDCGDEGAFVSVKGKVVRHLSLYSHQEMDSVGCRAAATFIFVVQYPQGFISQLGIVSVCEILENS